MAQGTSPSRITYFQEVPVAAIVYSNLLINRANARAPGTRLRQFASHALTALLLFISLTGMYMAGSVLLKERASPGNTTPAVQQAPAATAPERSAALPESPPTLLEIPSIGLKASTVEVGQNSDGSMEVPGPDVVGWYNLGPSPGELGPAVMNGHVDSAISGPAIFWDLEKVQIGDEVRVTRADGRTVSFTVEKSESYDQSNFPTKAVYGNLGYPGLRLITCDGEFNQLTRHYSHNLVVYARANL